MAATSSTKRKRTRRYDARQALRDLYRKARRLWKLPEGRLTVEEMHNLLSEKLGHAHYDAKEVESLRKQADKYYAALKELRTKVDVMSNYVTFPKPERGVFGLGGLIMPLNSMAMLPYHDDSATIDYGAKLEAVARHLQKLEATVEALQEALVKRG